ncbi:MAG: IS110 family transposase [Neisseria sp.]|jgi:pilin gene inverting protein pivNM-1B|uniref:IS110 family transposase n=1 Tax=Neisseria sp. TaxID=192066 RepID=UPI001CB3BE78|nr:IS110 family transposase [Neisseria sp.]MBF1277227.1 IS110 family transposase [Neisseria sp.]
MNVIGLDVSKDTIDATLITTKGSKDYIKISNSTDGFENLINWIKTKRIRKIAISMEATGIYYEQAAEYLSALYTVYVINPLKIKEYAKSQFSHTKTDKADSKLIAEFANRHLDKLTSFRPSENPTLYKLINLLQQLKEQQKETQNRLHTAKDIYIKSTHEAIIELLEEKIDQTSKRIEVMIKQKESLNIEYQNLQTIPAIGKETAVILLRHLTDKNFETANKFVAFAGLSPKIEQSGTSVYKKGRLSIYGHRQLKRALFMPALVAYRMNAFPQLVRNLEAAKKPKMIIIVALMRKLAKIAFYIHKTKKPFDKARHQTV